MRACELSAAPPAAASEWSWAHDLRARRAVGAGHPVTQGAVHRDRLSWGWGASLFNATGGPIEPFIPMMLFAIVFGLSMDYEVFLLSRIKEEYEHTADAAESVADGLAATARVITAAAAIMVAVFGSFVLEDDRVIKIFGLGLASAIALDASLVRLLLVPATMELLGDKNWWLPKWLDRLLPNLKVEGNRPAPPKIPDTPLDLAASGQPVPAVLKKALSD